MAVVRDGLARLPATSAVTHSATRAAARCAEAQIRAHAVPTLGSVQLEQWASREVADSPLGWREFLAGAASSVLAVHALIVAAADERTTPAEAEEIDKTYLSICALSTMLDSLIDYQRDMRAARLATSATTPTTTNSHGISPTPPDEQSSTPRPYKTGHTTR